MLDCHPNYVMQPVIKVLQKPEDIWNLKNAIILTLSFVLIKQ
jgi:hypothetical protein